MEPGKDKPFKKAKVEASGSQMKETLMERNRRGKMSNLYSDLHSLVPNLFPKATRTTIIDGTISYIQDLENAVKELETRKKAELNHHLSLQTLNTSSVDMMVSGRTAFFGIRSASRPGLVSRVVHVFETHKTEILGVSVACEDRQMTMMVSAVINGAGDGFPAEFVIPKIKSDLLTCLS